MAILSQTVLEVLEELISCRTNEYDEAYPNNAKRLQFYTLLEDSLPHKPVITSSSLRSVVKFIAYNQLLILNFTRVPNLGQYLTLNRKNLRNTSWMLTDAAGQAISSLPPKCHKSAIEDRGENEVSSPPWLAMTLLSSKFQKFATQCRYCVVTKLATIVLNDQLSCFSTMSTNPASSLYVRIIYVGMASDWCCLFMVVRNLKCRT